MVTFGDGWSALQWLVGAWLLARVPTPDGAPPDLRGPAGHPAAGRVSVVIPARNEAASLPALLRSLSAQTCPAGEIVVVDDDSTDATASIAVAGGATVLASGGPPAGWVGKTWACHRGSQSTAGDILVFLDADVTLAPDGLARLLAVRASSPSHAGGLLSVEPFHQIERLYERLSAVCNLVSLTGSGAFTGPPRRATKVAFGPCLIISRRDYARIGGHAHPDVRGRVTEDLALAERARGEGIPVRLLGGGRTVQFRMYPSGLRQLVDGWTKALASGARGAPLVAVIGTSVWVWGALAATGSGIHAALGPHRLTSAIIYGAWAVEVAWMLRRVGGFGWATAALFPVPLAAFVVLFVRSGVLLALRRPRQWRGRAVSGR